MKILKLTASKNLNEKVFVKEIEDSLEAMQAEVDGSIEFYEINIGGKFYDVVLNDEGKLLNLKPNIAVFHDGKLADMIVGDVILVTANEEGETLGLSEEDIALLTDYFSSKGIVSSEGILSYYEF